MSLDLDEVERRVPTLQLIEDNHLRKCTAALTTKAPDYFWSVPASTSGYHHPLCRMERGLWIHTLMLSTVIDRLSDSYVEQGLIEESAVDRAHAAAILHDQRKNGVPDTGSSVGDHELLMADVIRDAGLPEEIASAVESHMGPWYSEQEPESELDRLVHTADMVASTPSITPAIQEPLPSEFPIELGIEEVDLR
jgi:hypothetical protein